MAGDDGRIAHVRLGLPAAWIGSLAAHLALALCLADFGARSVCRDDPPAVKVELIAEAIPAVPAPRPAVSSAPQTIDAASPPARHKPRPNVAASPQGRPSPVPSETADLSLPPFTAASSASEQAPAAPVPAEAPPADDSGAANDPSRMTDYASLLHTLVSVHKVYPQQAMRRGEQGVIRLRVTLATDGTLVEVEAENDAVSPRLRAAAIQAVRNAAPFPSVPLATHGRPTTFVVSLNYFLQ